MFSFKLADAAPQIGAYIHGVISNNVDFEQTLIMNIGGEEYQRLVNMHLRELQMHEASFTAEWTGRPRVRTRRRLLPLTRRTRSGVWLCKLGLARVVMPTTVTVELPYVTTRTEIPRSPRRQT